MATPNTNPQARTAAPRPAGANPSSVSSKPAQTSAPSSVSAKPAVAAPAETKETKATKYETMVVGVSESRKPQRKRLEGLADQLGCKPSDLIWAGIAMLLANPPKVAPEGSSASSGTSPGFWVLHTRDGGGKFTGVRVVEVASRNQIAGGDRAFFRFKDGEPQQRQRAMNQAERAAKYDLSIAGVAQEVTVEEFDENATY